MSECPKCGAVHATHRADGRARCQAHRKQIHGGVQCGAIAVRDRKTCRAHNGTGPVGVEHHSFKHGRKSKYLRREGFTLRQRAEEFLDDPQILSLVPQLALLDARTEEVLEALDGLAPAEAWAEIRAAVVALRRAEGPEQNKAALARIIRAAERGAEIATVREELWSLGERRRAMVSTEARRIEGEREAISYERALGLLLLILDAVFREVPDQRARRRIRERVQMFLPRQITATAGVDLGAVAGD